MAGDPAGLLGGLQYLVAFQNNAMDDPGLIATVATPPGTLGGHNVWTDITRYITANDAGTRGRQHELQQFEAGTRTLQLYNADGRFTPANTSSPYSPYVVIRKPFQVRETWSSVVYPRFTGQVDSWGTSWPDAGQQYSLLHVSDAFRMFNLADITSGGYPAQILADGATAYWRLSEPAGTALTTVTDSGPNGYNGTYAGTYSLGNTGALLASPATSANFMPSGSAPTGWASLPAGSAPTTSTFTVEAWVNSPSWADGVGLENVIYKWDDAAGDTGYVYIDTTAKLTLFVNIFGGNQEYVASVGSVGAAAWHHVVVTCTGTTVAMYIDGVAQSLTTHVSNNVSFTANQAFISYDYGSVTYAGELQELAVYAGTVLTPTQVSNHFQLASWPQEGSGSRIVRVLNAVGWNSTGRSIDGGKSPIQAQTSSLTTTSSLSHMQDVEATEGGALFITAGGAVQFWGRPSLQSATWTTTNQATFGDNTAGGDMPFLAAPTLAMDDIDLYNEAVATRTGGNTQIWPPAVTASITDNGRVTWSPPATLIGISDQEVLSMCQYVVSKYSTPVNRLSAITVDVVSVANTFPAAIPALLALELLFQVTVERTIIPGGGGTFTQTCDIEHITETINAAAGTWTITFGMEISDPLWWVLGTSQLGTSTRLAW